MSFLIFMRPLSDEEHIRSVSRMTHVFYRGVSLTAPEAHNISYGSTEFDEI